MKSTHYALNNYHASADNPRINVDARTSDGLHGYYALFPRGAIPLPADYGGQRAGHTTTAWGPMSNEVLMTARVPSYGGILVAACCQRSKRP